MSAGHTPGPWWWEVDQKNKQVCLKGMSARGQTTVMDFRRYGTQSAQPAFCNGALLQTAHGLAVVAPGREHHAAWFKTLAHPDARLIASAPDHHEAAKAIEARIVEAGRALPGEQPKTAARVLEQVDAVLVPSDVLRLVLAAIAKAEGGSQ